MSMSSTGDSVNDDNYSLTNQMQLLIICLSPFPERTSGDAREKITIKPWIRIFMALYKKIIVESLSFHLILKPWIFEKLKIFSIFEFFSMFRGILGLDNSKTLSTGAGWRAREGNHHPPLTLTLGGWVLGGGGLGVTS